MSHSVTITRTTTTSSTSALILNTGYLKTPHGILKLLQLILGTVCVGIVGHYYSQHHYTSTEQLFFLLMAVTFMIGTFCILLSCVISLSTGSIISKTIYEVVYHGVATVLYISAALSLLTEANRRRTYAYEAHMAASIIGLVVAVLYLISTILAVRTYKGL